MADTSELLRLCDEILDGIPTSDETFGEIHAQVTVARALKSRLQAEAQAPTTDASVLTEDERESVENAREVVGLKGYECDCDAKGLVAIIDRLTVGAPAPAPTTDRRKIEDRRGTATEEQERAWTRAGMVKKRVGKIERRAVQQDSPDRFAPNELTAGDTP